MASLNRLATSTVATYVNSHGGTDSWYAAKPIHDRIVIDGLCQFLVRFFDLLIQSLHHRQQRRHVKHQRLRQFQYLYAREEAFRISIRDPAPLAPRESLDLRHVFGESPHWCVADGQLSSDLPLLV
ncbi:MAG: hypothetical protein H0W76_02740 [Pyrinomonadaceae bacterium]|nr:hypothetical protein [Pyrinomonadaceae bacterium]